MDPGQDKVANSDRRCIPAACVVRRLQTPDLRAPHAWTARYAPGGAEPRAEDGCSTDVFSGARRLDTQTWQPYSDQGPKAESRVMADETRRFETGFDKAMVSTISRCPPADFGELVDRCQTESLSYVRRLTGNPATAEDLFQDTFLRAFGGFARLRPGSNHRAWLYRIATNLFLNHRRRAAVVPRSLSRLRCPAENCHHLLCTMASSIVPPCAGLSGGCPGDSGPHSFSGSCTGSATVTWPQRSGVPRRRRGPTSTRRSAVSVAN